MWKVVIFYDIPMVTQEDQTQVEKLDDRTTRAEQEKVLLNAKAHLFLSLALSMEENEIVEDSHIAKVLDTLQTHHEGTRLYHRILHALD